MLRALIFDLDGTLADTEETHRQAFNAAFIQFELWWDWGPQRYAELLRVSGGKERIAHYIGTLAAPPAERARLMELVPALHRTKTRIYTELLEQGRRPFRPGVLRLLREAKSRRLALAIASTGSSASVAALLHANLASEPGIAFDVIVCADQVPAKKPAPDIYNLALSSLRLAADECIAFEDSVNGLRAAKAAGLVAVVTPTRWNVDEDYRGADLVQPSLEEPPLDVARLELLLGGTRAAA
jgi:HAD superfamily hydrolase (TIGR01509 family)